jgi:transposase
MTALGKSGKFAVVVDRQVAVTTASGTTPAPPAPERPRKFCRNLDFIPLSNFDRPARLSGSNLRVLGRTYRLWLSRPMPENGKPKSWEMSTDARGRWYVNIQVEIADGEPRNGRAIDLGLKDLVALSNGDKIQMPAFRGKARRPATAWPNQTGSRPCRQGGQSTQAFPPRSFGTTRRFTSGT